MARSSPCHHARNRLHVDLGSRSQVKVSHPQGLASRRSFAGYHAGTEATEALGELLVLVPNLLRKACPELLEELPL